MRAFHAALDEVAASSGPAALVTTSATDKFYSNGLDLGWQKEQIYGENAAIDGLHGAAYLLRNSEPHPSGPGHEPRSSGPADSSGPAE